MKPQKKIANSFITIIIAISLIYGLIFVVTLKVIENNYYNYKYSSIYNYYLSNSDKTLKELLDFSYNQGFIVGKVDGGQSYQNFLQEIALDMKLEDVELKIEPDQNKFIVETNAIDFSLNINPNVVNDIIIVIYSFGMIIFLIFIILIVIMYFLVSKRIIKPLLLISNYLENLAEFKEVKYPVLKKNDEINLILSRIILLDESVKRELKNKKEILRAISHEFRTPLSQITTILYLHENNIKEYEDFNYSKDKITSIINENNKLIDMSLKSFDNSSVFTQEEIELSTLIKEHLENYKSENINKVIEINLDKIIYKGNAIFINLIINNLLSNISKYSKSYIKIYEKDKEIIFENDHDIKKKIKPNVGSTIVESLAKSENIKIKVKLENQKYTTHLELR